MIIVPFLGSLSACGPVAETVCDNCKRLHNSTCDAQAKKAISDGCNAMGFFVTYTVGFGWIPLVLGIVAASLACCICCQCCALKQEKSDTTSSGTVMGQAVQ